MPSLITLLLRRHYFAGKGRQRVAPIFLSHNISPLASFSRRHFNCASAIRLAYFLAMIILISLARASMPRRCCARDDDTRRSPLSLGHQHAVPRALPSQSGHAISPKHVGIFGQLASTARRRPARLSAFRHAFVGHFDMSC